MLKAWFRLEVKKDLYEEVVVDSQELDAGKSGRRPQAWVGPGLLGRHRHELRAPYDQEGK